jgi:hypothetical protein
MIISKMTPDEYESTWLHSDRDFIIRIQNNVNRERMLNKKFDDMEQLHLLWERFKIVEKMTRIIK